MPKKKLTLAQDPIGDRFDRCVTARRKQLGVDGAKRVCASSLNRAHPGALAAAQRKANAMRKAGKLPPRAARGSKWTSGVKLIGDVRKGDVFQIGKHTYLAKSSAKPVRVRGKYVVKLTVATGSGDTTRAMQRSVKSKVRVLQQVVRARRNPTVIRPERVVERETRFNPMRTLGMHK